MLRAILQGLLAVLAVLVLECCTLADDVPRWEWQPYRVQAVVTVDRHDFEAVGRSKSVMTDLKALAERVIGPSWQFAIRQAELPGPPDVADGVPPWTLLKHADSSAADVWLRIHLRIAAGQSEWHIQSWQPDLESVSPVVNGTTWDDRTVPERLFSTIRELFRPVARIEAVHGSDVRLLLRAGELSPADPELAWVRAGDLLDLAVVFAPQGTTAGQLRSIPWTLIEIEAVDHATLTGRVHSGLRQALSARSRGRMQQLGGVIRPWYDRSELVVQTYGASPRRLGGSRVTVAESLGEDAPPPVELLTDRLGRLNLPRQDTSLRWLTIWSGSQRLARVPVAPGAESRFVLEVPDDSVRLRVEGQLQILQDRLVDAVASRNTLLISLRKLAKQERWDAVEAGRKKLAELTGPAPFLQDLTGIRVPAVQAARQQKNRAAEIKINRLCDETAEIIRQHLGDEKLKVFREELAELERAAKAGITPAEPTKPADR